MSSATQVCQAPTRILSGTFWYQNNQLNIYQGFENTVCEHLAKSG